MPITNHPRGDSLLYRGPQYTSSLVGKWVFFTIKASLDDPDPGLLQKKFLVGDTEDARNHIPVIDISAAEMEVIPVGTFHYDIQVVEDINPRKVTTLEISTLQVVKDATNSIQLPTDSGVPQVLEFILPTLHTTSTSIPVTTFTYENATHYQFTDSATPPALNDVNWIAVGSYVPTIAAGAEGSFTRYAWVKSADTVSAVSAAQNCVVDLPSAVTFSVASVSVAEGSQTTLTITRAGSLYGPITLSVAQLVGGTAGAGDYTLSASSVTFASDDGAAKTITLTAAADALSEGDEVSTLRLTTTAGQASYGANRDLTVTIVDASQQTDTIPFAPLPSFVAQIGVEPSTPTTSNIIQPTGYNAATTISVNFGEYRLDGGAWTSAAGSITPGQTVQLRHTTSSLYLAPLTQIVTIGGVAGSFQTTTRAATPVSSYTILVDPVNGDDNNTYAQAISDPDAYPFATLGRALWGASSYATAVPLEAAQAGDTVLVLPATYTAPGQAAVDRFAPAFRPINSGTNGSPITIKAQYRGSRLAVNDANRCILALSSGVGPVYGTYQKDDVIWDGFFTDEAVSTPSEDSGTAVIVDSARCEINGGRFVGSTVAWNNNHPGIRFEHSTGCKAMDNYGSGYSGASNAGNCSFILLYASNNYEVGYNRAVQCKGGIFAKGDQASYAPTLIENPASIHHNLITEVQQGISLGGIKPASGMTDTCDVYQNLVVADLVDAWGASQALNITIYDNISASYWRVVNNTFVGRDWEGIIFVGNSDGLVAFNGSLFQNNICQNQRARAIFLSYSVPVATFNRATYARNRYHTDRTTPFEFSDGAFTLAERQTASEETGSSMGDPAFVGGGSYKLATGSPCLGAGVDVLNLLGGGTSAAVNQGCYVAADQSDQIGPRAAA